MTMPKVKDPEKVERYDKLIKAMQLFNAGDPESKDLALVIIREVSPALWSALLNLTYHGKLTPGVMEEINKNILTQVGNKVKYRGMEGCPTMVVTHVQMEELKTLAGPVLITKVKAKFFNKSTWNFSEVIDRVE